MRYAVLALILLLAGCFHWEYPERPREYWDHVVILHTLDASL